MATNITIPEVGAKKQRVLSVDIFRGLTMLVMIFVNEVSEAKAVPWWTRHAPARADYMTYVDMVFPSFLFIVGMALPLAIGRRIEKGDSTLRLWGHVLLRTLALVTLGLLLANHDLVNPALTHMSAGIWTLVALAGALLLWNVYPRSDQHAGLYRMLKIAGVALMIFAAVIFRRTTEQGNVEWFDFSYWEILGLIGWAYLATCILYLPFRKIVWMPAVWFVALTALCACVKAGWIGWLDRVPSYLWPFENGAHASIIMAGIVVSMLFFDKRLNLSPRMRTRSALLFALVLFAAGWVLTPLGISKIRGTPTWCLYTCAADTLLFLLLYWVVDVKGWSRWAAFVKPAGSNTLLTYLLPFIIYAIPGYLAFAMRWSTGWDAILRGVTFTALVLALAAILTRWKLRLQL